MAASNAIVYVIGVVFSGYPLTINFIGGAVLVLSAAVLYVVARLAVLLVPNPLTTHCLAIPRPGTRWLETPLPPRCHQSPHNRAATFVQRRSTTRMKAWS